jgi:hypothetical protein
MVAQRADWDRGSRDSGWFRVFVRTGGPRTDTCGPVRGPTPAVRPVCDGLLYGAHSAGATKPK